MRDAATHLSVKGNWSSLPGWRPPRSPLAPLSDRRQPAAPSSSFLTAGLSTEIHLIIVLDAKSNSIKKSPNLHLLLPFLIIIII